VKVHPSVLRMYVRCMIRAKGTVTMDTAILTTIRPDRDAHAGLGCNYSPAPASDSYRSGSSRAAKQTLRDSDPQKRVHRFTRLKMPEIGFYLGLPQWRLLRTRHDFHRGAPTVLPFYYSSLAKLRCVGPSTSRASYERPVVIAVDGQLCPSVWHGCQSVQDDRAWWRLVACFRRVTSA